ncbi:MAG: hypothetical protein QNI99_10850 [Woeseiaceae bacterium]|nr:hypothetical protein [Woeseiaceae bacterium]
MIQRVALALLLVAISGCAARNVPHNPASMEAYVSDYCFTLESDVTYTERRGLMNVQWEQGLRAGVYRGALEADNGYFFIGPERAVCQANPECGEFGTGLGGGGGVWVSKDSDDDFRLFVTQLPQDTSGIARDHGALIAWLVRNDDGKMFIFDRNEEFVAEMARRRGECPPE